MLGAVFIALGYTHYAMYFNWTLHANLYAFFLLELHKLSDILIQL